ncbi:hypothetical protein R3P38DRAFT_1952951 [Favolaschia claudopus]|uniref:Uncharacterized protein n=1 Tax=Favolaschia claudopus TaxID=2862362 RepID=A0AAV9ZZW8_9AGAR
MSAAKITQASHHQKMTRHGLSSVPPSSPPSPIFSGIPRSTALDTPGVLSRQPTLPTALSLRLFVSPPTLRYNFSFTPPATTTTDNESWACQPPAGTPPLLAATYARFSIMWRPTAKPESSKPYLSHKQSPTSTQHLLLSSTPPLPTHFIHLARKFRITQTEVLSSCKRPLPLPLPLPRPELPAHHRQRYTCRLSNLPNPRC